MTESTGPQAANHRYDELLLVNLKQLGDRLDTHAEEERAELRAIRNEIATVRQEAGAVREEIVAFRVRLSVVWGIASCLGGALVIGAAKLVGALRG